MAGKFITFEGGEGSGKTTQIKLLEKFLNDSGKKCLVTREPGGSVQAEEIRKLLLTGATDKWSDVSEVLLFQAARVEHVEHVIKPALMLGEIVLCDRFLDSSLVYQGIGKGLGVEYIHQIHRLTLGNFAPELTIILDIDPAIGLSRARVRQGEEMRFEAMDIGFHYKVRDGFLALASANAGRYLVVDASQALDVVSGDIINRISQR